MQKFRNDALHYEVGYPIIGKNSEAFTEADAVHADGDGFLALITTSSKVLGFSIEPVTMASDNQTVAAVKPQYVRGIGTLMVYGADQAATQTDVGAYADMGTVTSGAMELNLAAGGTGQFFVHGFDPEAEADTDAVVVEIAEPQVLAFAQS